MLFPSGAPGRRGPGARAPTHVRGQGSVGAPCGIPHRAEFSESRKQVCRRRQLPPVLSGTPLAASGRGDVSPGGEESRTALAAVAFILRRAFVMLPRKARRKGRGRGGEAGRQGRPRRRLPRRRLPRLGRLDPLSDRFSACQRLTARACPPPPSPGTFPGNPTSSGAPSRGIPENTIPNAYPGGPPHRSADSGGTHGSQQGALGAGVESQGHPRHPARVYTHTQTHTHAHSCQGTGPLGHICCGYSLVSLSVSLAESGAAGGTDGCGSSWKPPGESASVQPPRNQ